MPGQHALRVDRPPKISSSHFNIYACLSRAALSVSANLQEVAATGTDTQYHGGMKRKHQRTLELIFSRPVSGSLPWRDVEALFQELGGEVSERAGSRVAVVLFGEVRVFHRPHPSPDTDKGAIASIRKWFEEHGVTP